MQYKTPGTLKTQWTPTGTPGTSGTPETPGIPRIPGTPWIPGKSETLVTLESGYYSEYTSVI